MTNCPCCGQILSAPLAPHTFAEYVDLTTPFPRDIIRYLSTRPGRWTTADTILEYFMPIRLKPKNAEGH